MIDKDMLITLENGKEYGVIETIILNDTEYILMLNINDNLDMQVKQIRVDDGEQIIIDVSEDKINQVIDLIGNKIEENILKEN